MQISQMRGMQKILDWVPKNFHKLKENNKVKVWCKVYDRTMPNEAGASTSLAQMVKNAEERLRVVEKEKTGKARLD